MLSIQSLYSWKDWSYKNNLFGFLLQSVSQKEALVPCLLHVIFEKCFRCFETGTEFGGLSDCSTKKLWFGFAPIFETNRIVSFWNNQTILETFHPVDVIKRAILPKISASRVGTHKNQQKKLLIACCAWFAAFFLKFKPSKALV